MHTFQLGASVESIASNVFDTISESHTRQTGTTTESFPSNVFDAVWNGEVC